MKKLLLAGLLIATLLLLLLSGCKIGGKAIALPNVTATNIANFPYQFLTSTGSTIGYASTMIFAPAAYSTQVTDLMNFMRQKACQLTINQGYGCVDSQGNPLTGGAVFGLRGITGGAIAGQATEVKLYLCRRDIAGLIYDHYIGKNYCEHLTQKVLGRVPTTQPATGDTVQLTLCKKTAAPYRDDLVVGENGCGTNEDMIEYIGYAYKTQPTGIATSAITTCRFNSNGEQFVTDGTGCPSGSNNLVTYWILPFCEDSDNGKNDWTAGGAYSHIDKTNYTDYCSGGSLVEYYCDASAVPFGVKSETLACPQGYPCINGACTAQYSFNLHKEVSKYKPEIQEVNYTIVLDNDGARIDEGSGMTLKDQIPNGLTIKSVIPEPTSTTGNLLEWRFEKFDNRQGETQYATRADTKEYESHGRFIVNIIAEVNEAILPPGTDVINKANVTIGTFFREDQRNFVVQQRPTVNLTMPVYRCWNAPNAVMNHYLSFDPNCEGNHVDGLIGHVYKEQQQGTIALYQCRRGTRYNEITFYDNFASTDPNCEGKEGKDLIGYIPASATTNTKTIYRCWNYPDHITSGKFDHMVSEAINCEGYNNEGVEFYFLAQPVTTQPGPPAPTLGGSGSACTQDSNCSTGLRCIFNICTERTNLYNCYFASKDEYYPSRNPACPHPITQEQGTGVQIGYMTEYAFPNTIRWGLCIDTTTYSIPIFYPGRETDCSAGQTFQYVGTIFTQQRTGTTTLYARQGPQTQLTPTSWVSYKYYYTTNSSDDGPVSYTSGNTPGYVLPYPEHACGNGMTEPPETCDDGNLVNGDGCDSNCQIEIIAPGYCGDGTVQASLGETCEPPNTATCDANCHTIIAPLPANVTNYTYVPPTTNTPPSTTPFTITTNYIAIGTCADNLIIADSTYGLGSIACAQLLPGEARIELKQVGTIIGLIIAGGSSADVNPAIQVLKNLTKWSAEGPRLDVTNNMYLTTVGRLSSTTGAWLYNMEYRLPAGIHFLGVPFSLASKAIANNPAINVAGGIFAYDATNNRSVKFDVDWPASPPALSDLSLFGNELEAYYVKASTATTFMLRDATKPGAAGASITRNVAAGWVAYTPYMKQKTLSQIIPVGVTVNSLWCYENNQFVQKNLALNPTIDVGQGCWINLAGGATLS